MKRFLALVLCVAVLMSFHVVAFATEYTPLEGRIIVDGVDITIDIEEEIYRAKNGITDVDMPSMMTISSDSDDLQLYTTTRKISTAKPLDNDAQLYATTSVAVMPLASEDKLDTDSINYFHVTAYGTVYWRDNLGINNDFLGASGGWDPDTNPDTGKLPVLSNRQIELRASQFEPKDIVKNFTTTKNTFEISKSQFNYDKMWSYVLTTNVLIDSTNKLRLRVESGFFT